MSTLQQFISDLGLGSGDAFLVTADGPVVDLISGGDDFSDDVTYGTLEGQPSFTPTSNYLDFHSSAYRTTSTSDISIIYRGKGFGVGNWTSFGIMGASTPGGSGGIAGTMGRISSQDRVRFNAFGTINRDNSSVGPEDYFTSIFTCIPHTKVSLYVNDGNPSIRTSSVGDPEVRFMRLLDNAEFCVAAVINHELSWAQSSYVNLMLDRQLWRGTTTELHYVDTLISQEPYLFYPMTGTGASLDGDANGSSRNIQVGGWQTIHTNVLRNISTGSITLLVDPNDDNELWQVLVEQSNSSQNQGFTFFRRVEGGVPYFRFKSHYLPQFDFSAGPVGERFHLAITWDGSDMVFYINGEQVYTSPCTTSSIGTTDFGSFGRIANGGFGTSPLTSGGIFEGLMQRGAIWQNVTLTPEQVLAEAVAAGLAADGGAVTGDLLGRSMLGSRAFGGGPFA